MNRCPHHPELNWLMYIADQVPQRQRYERALGHCLQCQALFQKHISGELSSLPLGFLDTVMAGLPAKPANQWRRFKPILHYAAAASLTLVLLEVGFFDLIPNLPALTREIIPQGSALIGDLNEQLRGLLSLLRF